MSIETEVEFVVTTNKARKTFTITFCRGATDPSMRAVQAIFDSYQRPASGEEMVKFLRAAFANEAPRGPMWVRDGKI